MDNYSEYEGYSYPPPTPDECSTACCIKLVLAFISITLNLVLVLLSVRISAKGNSNVTKAYFFVVWLGMCNVMYILFNFVIYQLRRMEYAVPSLFECKFNHALQVMNESFAVYILVALSLDRYIMVTNHTRANTCIIRRRYLVILGIFLGSIAASIPILVKADIVELDGVPYFCYYLYHFETFAKVYEILRTVFLYNIPLTIIAFCYTRMAIFLFKSGQNAATISSTRVASRMKKRNRLGISVIIISVMFGVCYSLHHISNILYQFSFNENYPFKHTLERDLKFIGQFFIIINACAHPIIMLVVNRNLRADLFKIVCRCSRCDDYDKKISVEGTLRMSRVQSSRLSTTIVSSDTPRASPSRV
ncbi:galanin receptor type 1-like [Anneissia japonica]|uniref:galanin receptor type 1-like n=1 Tax=Anneissia japonica TaxID=1529436 RepID=UPI00142556F7|nr:galanin receptor type 1-like [Anneissia japonica]XP_033108537.1 galanin receptor type 1-like [Anneissia japonica]XP_033108538.1 galanin receptor type 1-like [Anneissia japonica]